MADLRKFGSTSNLVRFTLKNKSTGQGLTGLTGSTTGLTISTIADVEASATAYTQAATHIQTIATLGTYVAPTASECRFGEVDNTNHKGLYEFQIADARFAVSGAKRLIISVNDAENTILDADYEVELVQFDPFDTVRLGLTSLPNTAVTTNGSLITSGSGTDQLHVSSGQVSEVALVDTLTTYTGDTPQTGDSFVRIGANGAGLTSLAPAATALSAANWTNTRAGYLDNLSGGAVALASTALSTSVWTGTLAGYIGNLPTAFSALSTQVGSPMQVYAQPSGFLTATFPSNVSAYAGGAVASVAAPVTVGTNEDKAGYSLGATGLDSISTAPPTGPPTTFTQMMVMFYRRFFGASVKSASTLTIKTLANDGETPITTQPYTDDGQGNETLGAAS